ncbi:MAG: hypothetical protein ABIO55_06945 [Ginsengibacter sp.]
MKNTLKLSAIFFICAFVQSCQKDIEDINSPLIPPVITTHDSVTRLSKLIFFEDGTLATDTTAYRQYFYDSLNRVISIKHYDYLNGNPIFAEIVVYFYTGNDSIAYKLTHEVVDPSNPDPDTDTSFFFYDNLQRLIKDSSISSIGLQVSNYTYSNTMITAMIRSVTNSDPLNPYMEKDTGFIGSAGDIIKTNSLTSTGEYYINNFTYDNHQNPFNQLNIRSTYNPVPGFNFFIEDHYLQKNNVVSLTYENQSFPGLIDNDAYTYTYNASGFPETVNISFESVPVDNYKIVFVYRRI